MAHYEYFGDFLYRFEQKIFFFSSRILDVGIYEKVVHFGVKVFHHHMKPVKESRFWDLDVSTKSSRQISDHDAVASGEKGEN